MPLARLAVQTDGLNLGAVHIDLQIAVALAFPVAQVEIIFAGRALEGGLDIAAALTQIDIFIPRGAAGAADLVAAQVHVLGLDDHAGRGLGHVLDADGQFLGGHAALAVIDRDDHLVAVVAIGIAGVFVIGRLLEGQHAGIGVDLEGRAIGTADDLVGQRIAIGILGGQVDDQLGVFIDAENTVRGDVGEGRGGVCGRGLAGAKAAVIDPAALHIAGADIGQGGACGGLGAVEGEIAIPRAGGIVAFDLHFDHVIGLAVRALQHVILFGIHLAADTFAIDRGQLTRTVLRIAIAVIAAIARQTVIIVIGGHGDGGRADGKAVAIAKAAAILTIGQKVGLGIGREFEFLVIVGHATNPDCTL